MEALPLDDYDAQQAQPARKLNFDRNWLSNRNAVSDAIEYQKRATPTVPEHAPYGYNNDAQWKEYQHALQPPNPLESKEYTDYMDQLGRVVGSVNARDIYRDQNYMSEGALKILNGKRIARKQKPLYGHWTSVDGDNIDEWVVRTKENGPIVAVNGYRTKKSDWDILKNYHHQYPSRAERTEHPFNEFLADYYREDPSVEYATDTAGFATDAYLKQRKKLQKDSKYAMHLPNPSAFNLFQKMVADIYHTIFDSFMKHPPNQKFPEEYVSWILTYSYGQGWLLNLISQLWSENVKEPVLRQIMRYKKYDEWTKAYVKLKRDKGEAPGDLDPTVNKDLADYLLRKKRVKNYIKEYVRPLLTTGSGEFTKFTNYVADIVKKLLTGVVVMKPGTNEHLGELQSPYE